MTTIENYLTSLIYPEGNFKYFEKQAHSYSQKGIDANTLYRF
jgi:hypothetical protein